MNTLHLPTCPKCGLPLPVDAPKGLCPRCLAAMNLADETAFTGADAVAAQTPLTPAELAPHFPQLEILECLGRGGMGVVYKARQKSLHRFVALKLLAPERAKEPSFAERFAKEAQALAALNHPHIVGVYDFGQAGGFYFLLMEFVDGVNLRQAMKAGRFTPEQALAVVPPVCEALQYAHEHGIVHRDIKPENLLLDKAGRVKIADFGIAKMLGAETSPANSGTPQMGKEIRANPESPRDPSAVVGTPQYMAPEQKAHRATDHRADIYSLGVVLYELLTGELPADKLQPPSRKVQIDVRLDEIVLRALETKPELRFQTAGEFRTQVETMADGAAPIPSAPASEYVSSWGFRLTPGPAIKTGYVRFWESLFGSVNSPGAINTLNLSRIGFIGIFAVLAIVPGWRWCWPAFAFLGMFGLIGAAYVSEAAARGGVDLSRTDGSDDAKSRRAVWRRRIVWLIVGGGVLPMAFFALSLIFSLGRGGEKAVEAATFGQMLAVFAKVLGIGLGLALLIWALLRVFWRKTADAANPWPRHPEAMVALSILWPLLLVTAPFAILRFVGSSEERLSWEALRAEPSRSGLLNAAEWVTFGLMLIVVVQGAIWVSRNLRQTMREANNPSDRNTDREVERSFPARKWWRKALVTLLLALALALVLHTWVLQAFVIPVKSLEPELTAGSRVLVWKLTRQFAPGDIIAHKHGAQVWVSRVVREEQDQLVLQRNGRAEEMLPRADVIGKVVSIFWRPTPRAGVPAVPSMSAGRRPQQGVDDVFSSSMEPEHLRSLSWHQFDQTPGRYWRELADGRRFTEAAKLIELYLSLHPELEEGVQRINGGNLHFHAAQCWAFAGDHERAQKHLSQSKHDAPDGDFLWNDYVAGTAAFLSGDRPALMASRDKLQAKGAAINQPNLAVLDRLIANFGQPYLEAYNSGQREGLANSNQSATSSPLSPPRVLSVDARPDGSSTVTYAVPTKVVVGSTWFRILAVLILFGLVGGGVVLLVVLFRKRSSTAAKVLAALGMVALLLFVLVGGLFFFYAKVRREDAIQAVTVARQAAMTESQKLEHQAAAAGFPAGAHISRGGHSVLVLHDSVDMHYVFYYAGDFGSSSSGSQNAKTRSWVDEGSVKLKTGRTFGYRRQALYPDELTVNGTRYDLGKGRVFILLGDGTLEQRSLSIPLALAKDPVALGRFITEHGGLPESAGAVWRVRTEARQASIDADVNAGEELLVFIGQESRGWASSPPKAGEFTATVEASSTLRLEDGSLGKGFIIRTFSGTIRSTANVAITPEGSVPFGELVFRANDAVSSKTGIFTFADIHQPDGKLVPVSVRVRTKLPVK